MPYLVDTNVATRRILPTDPQYSSVTTAIQKLRMQGEVLYITPQILVEFHALATRPQEANGLGLSVAQASLEARKIEAIFPLLPETPAVYPLWRNLVEDVQHYGATGL